MKLALYKTVWKKHFVLRLRSSGPDLLPMYTEQLVLVQLLQIEIMLPVPLELFCPPPLLLCTEIRGSHYFVFYFLVSVFILSSTSVPQTPGRHLIWDWLVFSFEQQVLGRSLWDIEKQVERNEKKWAGRYRYLQGVQKLRCNNSRDHFYEVKIRLFYTVDSNEFNLKFWSTGS